MEIGMKYLKKYGSLLFVLALLLAALAPLAASAEPYTYTVRFFAGNQGTFNGQSQLVISGLKYGDRVTFRQDMVTLNNGSKYYVKGIRESGKDNNTVSASAFRVTGDMDYVVAYGILGSSVAYTVNYQDTAGRTLAPSETHYGNVGDKPVIAYIYVDGYQPEAYNLTGTLQENAAENDFTFVYTRVTTPDAGQTGNQTANQTGNQTGNQGAGENAGGVVGTQNGENTPGGDATETEPEETAATQPSTAGGDGMGEDTENQGQTEPQELLDLDDEEIPLAQVPIGDNDSGKFPVAAAVIGGLVIFGGLAVAAFAVTRRKKDKE